MKIEQVVDMATSSNHLPMALAFLVGLFLTRRNHESVYDYSDTPGDNIPTTLIEGMER